MTSPFNKPLALLAAIALTATLSAPAAHAQYQRPDIGSMDRVIDPYEKGEVGVDEKPGAYVPKDVAFLDEDGKDVTLASYLGQGRPVILWLGYYECPALCDPMSGGMVRAVKDLKLDSGKEFAIVNVSINPSEVPGIAKVKRETYLKELGHPGEARGWNLLTGKPEGIAALTQAVGYKFKKVTADGETQYAHPAVLIVLSPEGKVTRYLYPSKGTGVEFDAQTMRLSLIEASEGKVGSPLDQFLLTCLRYDSHTGKYTWVAVRLMQYAGAVTVLVMVAVFVPYWIRSSRRGGGDGTGTDGGTTAGGVAVAG